MKTVKFKLKNIGYIDNGEIELGKLTVLTGKNNTGKTYINIAIYGFLKYFYQARVPVFNVVEKVDELFENGFVDIDIKQFEKDIKQNLERISKNYSQTLDSVFSSTENEFDKGKLSVEILNYIFNYKEDLSSKLMLNKTEVLSLKKEKKSSILNISFLDFGNKKLPPKDIIADFVSHQLGIILLKDYIKNPFAITSERTGIQLFWRELDIQKNILIDKIVKDGGKKFDPFEYLFNSISRYPIPIHHNIDYVRDYDNIRKSTSFIFKDKIKYSDIIKSIENILGGSFKYINKSFNYVPKKERGREKATLPLYLTSSAVKSLFSLDLYIRHIASKDDLLIIDEPELNLHPDNQRKMAKLLAVLVNSGINVFVSTHSDYFIKELNNLVMLSNDIKDKEKIMTEYKYNNNEILKPDDINLYVIDKHTTNKIQISNNGMDLELFDKIIFNQNEASDAIYYALGDDSEGIK